MHSLPVYFPSLAPNEPEELFRPPWLLRNAHVQTLTGAYVFGRWRQDPPFPSITTVLGQVLLDDGDRLVYHDDCPSEWKPGDPVVLLLHGLAGSHASRYMIRIGSKFNRLNLRTFRLDWRGSGAGMPFARYPYHSGRSEDLLAAVQSIQRLCPNSAIHVVGFSMGANVALKLLGEVGAASHGTGGITRAVAVCPPIDLSQTIEFIQTGLARQYNNYFARLCVRDVTRRKQLRPDSIVPEGWLARPPREMREFDESFTAPVCGFASAEAYYAHSSAKQYLPVIAVPTLIIAAQDDPLIPFDPFKDAVLSPAVQLLAPKYGGHMGFVTTTGPGWLDCQIIDWVTENSGDVRDSSCPFCEKR